MMKKAVILLSGGLDSTTCLAYAKSQGFQCYALSFSYGQKHNVELDVAKKIAEHFAVEKHQIVSLSIGDFGGSALTDKSLDIPDYEDNGEIPVTYVPARNTIMLSIALGFAEAINANSIFMGASAIDYSGYPDCRPEYFEAFRKLASLATKVGVEGSPITIETPLINLSKAETIELGHSLGVDYSMTISCYRATADGLACGTCDSCVFRKKGFSGAGLQDQTKYIGSVII